MASFLQTVVPEALAEACERAPAMRRARPRSFLNHVGVAASESDADPLRRDFVALTRSLLSGVVDRAMDMLDAAADQAAKSFIQARLPVPLSEAEEQRSAAGAPGAIVYPHTRLRMVRPGVARALVEDGMVVVYHCMDNAREMYGAPLAPLEFELDDGPAIEMLLLAYPEAVAVDDLPHPSEELEDKVSLAQVRPCTNALDTDVPLTAHTTRTQALFKEGFLLIDDEASKPSNDDDDDGDDDNPF